MAKQKEANTPVDEQYLMNIMAGNVPKAEKEAVQERAEEETEEKPKETPRRKHSRPTDYEQLFLRSNIITDRRSTFISKTNHEKLMQIATIMGDNLSIGGYIDNMLTQHFEQYGDEIALLLDKKFSNRFK